jgi:hypothetical protein
MHAWVKLRIHVYICRKCGCGRVNWQNKNGEWVTTFHTSSGHSISSTRRPPCEVGSRTAPALRKYEAAIAAAAR